MYLKLTLNWHVVLLATPVNPVWGLSVYIGVSATQGTLQMCVGARMGMDGEDPPGCGVGCFSPRPGQGSPTRPPTPPTDTAIGFPPFSLQT